MLYLEDFLELIENLPGELRDRFTEIRELDLQVQNGLDRNEERVRDFFRRATSMPQDDRQTHTERIREEYRKILEDSDEKVNLATAVHDLVKRYLGKLDVEIAKFKMELEADNPGITEVIEHRARSTDQSNVITKKERRRRRGIETPVNGPSAEWINPVAPQPTVSTANGVGREMMTSIGFSHPANPDFGSAIRANYIKKSQSYPNRLLEVRASVPTITIPILPPQPPQHSISQNQTLTPSQTPQPHTPAPTMRDRLPSAAPSTPSYGFLPSFTDQPESRHGRPRKLTPRVQEMLKEASHRHERTSTHDNQPTTSHTGKQHAMLSDEDDGAESGAEGADLSDQNDQQRWCICNQVSYGAMVACDNKDCPFEWFHYPCVGVTAPPKGKWFCPHCTAIMKRRNSKNLALAMVPE